MITENKATYADLIATVKSALSKADQVETVLQNMGSDVFNFYQSEKALDETKAQFIADAIHPIVKKKHLEALGKDLPRKNSKEYNEQVSRDNGYSAKWQTVTDDKATARSVILTYYKRVKQYAFEKPKTESVKKDFLAKISALILEGGKITECNFNLPKVMGYLVQAEQAGKQGLAK
jgi:hypothetical protein